MPVKPLSPALVSLIHHVELNKAEWWEKGIRRSIVAVLHNAWLSNESLTFEGVLEGIHKLFETKLDQKQVRAALVRLQAVAKVVCLPDGHYKLSEKTLAEVNKEIEEAEKIEAETRQTFIKLLKLNCPSLDPDRTWQDFKANFLLPLVKETGANTYRLLSRGKVEFSQDTLDAFLQSCPGQSYKGLKKTLQSFLDPKHVPTRSFILRHLNAYFFLEAGPLSRTTLEELETLSGKRPVFNIFVDTNFLFSMLELHENPANEAARSLSELASQLSGLLQLKFYVLPTTIAEIKHAISKVSNSLRGLRAMPSMADAASRAGLSGMASKFFQEGVRVGPLTPEDFFSPYTQNLLTVLKERGVLLFNEKVDHYKTEQTVIDDIMMQIEWQKQPSRRRREKTYEQLEHDMILWHFTQGKRPATVESPLDARYWVVTVDYRLIGFDAYKRYTTGAEVPICLDPAMLIQMLQLWVPRTEQYETALLNSLRLPYFFREFDPDAERVTLVMHPSDLDTQGLGF